jgi:hypothetical protein
MPGDFTNVANPTYTLYTHGVIDAQGDSTSDTSFDYAAQSKALGRSRYLSLTTFRRDGTAVSTPVWVVADNDQTLLVWTGANTWKVKRIRSRARVEVAACDFRGRQIGPRASGVAAIREDTERVLRLLARKYRWQLYVLRAWGHLTRTLARRPPSRSVVIEIVLVSDP